MTKNFFKRRQLEIRILIDNRLEIELNRWGIESLNDIRWKTVTRGDSFKKIKLRQLKLIAESYCDL